MLLCCVQEEEERNVREDGCLICDVHNCALTATTKSGAVVEPQLLNIHVVHSF
jgi:hypothetical protein